MKNPYTNLLFTLLLLLVANFTHAQVGTQVNYEDNFGPITLAYASQVNMKASYSGTDAGATVVIFWSGTSWDITIDVGSGAVLSFTSSVTTANNPPDLSAGNWMDVAADGTDLLGLSGSGTVDASLPVELVSFTGRVLNNENQLHWSTASETNNERFTIERSTNGRTFSALNEVYGHGTSTRTHQYNFSDKKPFPGTNYYRLRQIDFDGTFTLSEVIRLENSADVGKGVISVYPNPAPVGRLQARYFTELSGEVSVSLVSISGQVVSTVVHQVNGGWNSLNIETGDVVVGVYLLRVAQDDKVDNLRVLLR